MLCKPKEIEPVANNREKFGIRVVQKAPGNARTGCEKPDRSLSWSSGGALRLRNFRSCSPSSALSPPISDTAALGGSVRRLSLVSILRAVSSRESELEFKASKLDSVNSVGETVEVRGTTVVVTCSFRGGESVGDAGGKQGLGSRMASFGDSADGAVLTGNCSRPTGVGSAGLTLGIDASSTIRIVGSA